MTALVGAGLASFEACDLDPGGLGAAAGDATAPDSSPPFDATLDTSAPDVNPAETAADVLGGDAPDTCAPIETDCLNGIDDDCNGLTDCADPACVAGYTCVPGASGGFVGYALYDDTRAAPCPATYPTQTDTYEGLIFTPPACSPCTCTAQGASCGSATLTCSSGGTCSADGGASASLGAACADLDGGVAIDPSGSCSLGVPAATPGSCVPDGGVADASVVAFGKLSRACGASNGPGGGCSAGGVCVARPPTATQGICVSQATATTALCPSAYPHAHVTMPSATSFDDTRGCTSCTCAGPTGAACSGSATLYPLADCADDAGSAADASADGGPGAPVVLPADGNCHAGLVAGSQVFLSGALDAGVTSQGTCAASGGQVTGAVTPKDQTVYCCQK